MNPLATSKSVLSWFCVYTSNESVSKWKKILQIALTAFTVLMNTACCIVSGLAFHRLLSSDLENSFFALFQIASVSGFVYMVLVALYERKDITAAITSLSVIYDKYKTADSYHYLVEVNTRGDRIWPIFIKFGMWAIFLCTISGAVVSVSICLQNTGSFDETRVFHPFKYELPWNQSTLNGYFGEIVMGLCCTETYFPGNMAFLILFIDICLHHQAFYKMFNHLAQQLSERTEEKDHMRILRDLIRFHVSVKRWFLETTDIFSPILLVQLICSVIFTACLVFQLDLQLRHIDFSIFVVIDGGLISSANLFSYCFFGKMAMESFERMTDSLYDSNWYNMSVKSQKYLILMIRNTQKPIYYHGFNVAVLNLETYCKLTRSVATYYMLFKKLTS